MNVGVMKHYKLELRNLHASDAVEMPVGGTGGLHRLGAPTYSHRLGGSRTYGL